MTTRRLFEAIFAVSLFVIAVRRTLDPDLWWHLRTGEYILAQGIPRHDVFSFTVPGHSWITHEWLSQVFMWLVYRAGGLEGLILVFALLIAVSFWLIYARSAGRPYLASFVTLLAAFASAMTWDARPQVFNLLFLAAFLYVVEGVRGEALPPRALWALPPLTALWANFHSGYMLGVAVLLVYVVGEALSRWQPPEGGMGQAAWRQLLWVTPVALLAALLNPNGYHLWIYPFETLGSPAMQGYITEWLPPNFRLYIFWPFAGLLATGVLTFALTPRRPRFTDLLLFGGTAAAGLLSARNIPIFALPAVGIICRYVVPAVEKTRLARLASPPARAVPRRGVQLLNVLPLGVAILAGLLWVADVLGGNEETIGGTYPVAAVDYLEAAGLDGRRGYNEYAWGGYLIWRGLPVFVDGRADVYGDEFLHDYMETYAARPGWRAPLERFDVDYALLPKGSTLAVLLEESQGWQQRYADDLAVIFERVE
jgi:hypothetical protein